MKGKWLVVLALLALVEVAELCGFREYEHFSRTFKRETGKSPAEWRAGHGD